VILQVTERHLCHTFRAHDFKGIDDLADWEVLHTVSFIEAIFFFGLAVEALLPILVSFLFDAKSAKSISTFYSLRFF
jgi:hypothetical protein